MLNIQSISSSAINTARFPYLRYSTVFLSAKKMHNLSPPPLSSSTLTSPITTTATTMGEEVKADKPWLLVGLGNPGKKYDGTRHNVGFEMLDAIAEAEGISMSSISFKALFGKVMMVSGVVIIVGTGTVSVVANAVVVVIVVSGRIGNVPVILAKPQTFMNLSGHSVGSIVKYYQIPLKQVVVIFDDLDLPFASLRLLPKGGHGGHNGSDRNCRGTEGIRWETKSLQLVTNNSSYSKENSELKVLDGKQNHSSLSPTTAHTAKKTPTNGAPETVPAGPVTPAIVVLSPTTPKRVRVSKEVPTFVCTFLDSNSKIWDSLDPTVVGKSAVIDPLLHEKPEKVLMSHTLLFCRSSVRVPEEGMRSIIGHFNDDRNFPRLRIGIGRPPGKMDPINFVLRPFNRQEHQELDFTFQNGLEAVRILLMEGFDKSATFVNSTKSMKQFG
ncbi:hypothetical protein GIB67_036867 [Kingdonia uniflora]|uniref:peptidyl-tRNA hydrolase n=1 Tax=Kingdonia uniflora TaxID=39325 RepID=A0A7J7LX82_9MAGN|nr:hypothetical protein GIB67_036867 [Kingdonia uniflora]